MRFVHSHYLDVEQIWSPLTDETNDGVNTKSLTQTRWNSAFMTDVYKEKLEDSIDFNNIFSTFIPRNEQRKLFFDAV